LHPPKLIRQVIAEAEKKSISAAAQRYGIAYNTVSNWLKKKQLKQLKKQLVINETESKFDAFTIFTVHHKITGLKLVLNQLYLISAQELSSGWTIYCFSYGQVNAVKCFLEYILYDLLQKQNFSYLLKFDSCKGTFRQLIYQRYKNFLPLTKMLQKAESLLQVLHAAHNFNQLNKNIDNLHKAPLPFFIPKFSDFEQPQEIILLNTDSEIPVLKEFQTRTYFQNPDLLIQENKATSQRKNKQTEYQKMLHDTGSVIAIQYRKMSIACFSQPIYLLAAYDLKNGLLNFCFTLENNKSNKALYLLYLNQFFSNCNLGDLRFTAGMELDGIQTVDCKKFSRMINWSINKTLPLLQKVISESQDTAEMLAKSFIFLADFNLNLKANASIHPPFMLDNSTAAFDFKNNNLMINSLSLNARNSIMKVMEKSRKQNYSGRVFSPEQLLKIYDYFSNQKIKDQSLENRIIEEAGVLQLMGDLSRSGALLKIMLKDKSLDLGSKCILYISCGMQKFRSGDYLAARRYYRKAIVGSRRIGDYQTELSGLRNICALYLHQGQTEKAYRYLRMAQKTAFKLNSDEHFTKFYFLSGHYYFAKQEYVQAATEYRLSMEYANKANLKNDYTNAVTGLANCFMNQNKYKQALRYAKISLSGNQAVGLKIPLAISHLTCAQCYAYLKMYQTAETEVLKQLQILKDVNYPVLEFQGRHFLIRLLLDQNRFKQAETEFGRLENTAKQIDNIFLLKDFNELKKIFQKSLY